MPGLQSSNKDRELQEKILKDFELRRKIRQTVVPTDDGKVRLLLRQLGEPITLFGEREVRPSMRQAHTYPNAIIVSSAPWLRMPANARILISNASASKLCTDLGPMRACAAFSLNITGLHGVLGPRLMLGPRRLLSCTHSIVCTSLFV